MWFRLQPKDSLSEQEIEAGLHSIIRDGICSQAMGSLTTGVFLVGFAVTLGASNTVIGILGAIPFLLNILQLPTVLLVERIRARKIVVCAASMISRAVLPFIALIPLIPSKDWQLVAFVLGVALHSGFGAVSGCAWNSWMRDLVPQDRLGSYFGNRLFLATAMGVVVSLVAAFGLDAWKSWQPQAPIWGYSILFFLGALVGQLGIHFLAKTPEPRMPAPDSTEPLHTILAQPFRSENFRKLVCFMGAWNFAVNLAAPFFTVYMLKRLGYGMSFVVIVTVISQVTNLLVVRTFGKLADRFSNKSVLGVCTPIFLLCIFGWTFTTLPDAHAGTIPLLIAIHALMGMATAGVTLASSNIGLKLAPLGEATPYIAAISLVNSVAAGVAPILGGLMADFFATQELSLLIRWAGEGRELAVEALSFQSWDFYFLFATLIGLYAIHRLSLVEEIGEVEEQIVRDELMLEARRTIRNLSTVGGMRALTVFPFPLLHKLLPTDQNSVPAGSVSVD